MPSRGSDAPFIMFVGDAPREEDDISGKPFSGKVGKKFESLVQRADIPTDWVRLSNAVGCRPVESGKSRKLTDIEIASCSRFIEAEIVAKKPAIIIALGNSALYSLTGQKGITKKRGIPIEVELPSKAFRWARFDRWYKKTYDEDPKPDQYRKYLEESGSLALPYRDLPTETFTVLPTFHPAALLYRDNEGQENEILSDLVLARKIVTGEDLSSGDYQMLMDLESIEEAYTSMVDLYREGAIKRISFDVETNGNLTGGVINPYREDHKLLCWSFSYKEGHSFVIPFQHRESPFANDGLAQQALVILTNDLLGEVPVTGHNLKFDYKASYVHGIVIQKVYGDTFLKARSLFSDTSLRGLEFLSTKFTDMIQHKSTMGQYMEQLPKEERNYDNAPLDLLMEYNGADTDAQLRLENVFDELLDDLDLRYNDDHFMTESVIPFAHLELDGAFIDTSVLEKADKESLERLEEFRRFFIDNGYAAAVCGVDKEEVFNVGSSKQLAVLLYDELGMDCRAFTAKGARSTARLVLEDLRKSASEEMTWLLSQELVESERIDHLKKCIKVIDTTMQQKKIKKIHSTYIAALPRFIRKDGCVHPEYGIRDASTGRCRCRNPSIHTTPWRSVVKQAYISRFEDGLILSNDFKQQEFRIATLFSGEDALIKIWESGEDIHQSIAANVLAKPRDQVTVEERRRIKMVGFGVLYGRGPGTIAEAELISMERAKQIIADFFKSLPKLKAWIEKMKKVGVRDNFVVTPHTGFRRLFPDTGYTRDQIERRAVNSPIQNLASDLTLRTFVRIFHKLQKLYKTGQFHSKVFGFIHDAVDLDVAPMELFEMVSLAKKEMEVMNHRAYPWLNVPLKWDGEVGVSWGELCAVQMGPEPRTLEISGPVAHFDKLVASMTRWDTPAEILSVETVEKDGGEEKVGLIYLPKAAVRKGTKRAA